jgi:hypothetical protein
MGVCLSSAHALRLLGACHAATMPPCSYVTHETKHFIYWYMGSVALLLFKSG